MVNYKDFYKFLLKNKLITPIWEYVLNIIDNELIDSIDKDYYLIIFTMYFSLICDGNIGISLDKERLLNKWNTKINHAKILLEDNDDFDLELFNYNIEVVNISVDNTLSKISETNLPLIIGRDKIFVIDDNWLYLRKYDTARKGVKKSINRLFTKKRKIYESDSKEILDSYKYPLSLGQTKAVNEGVNNNLIITGGPGTGKTTSILFLLLNILKNNNDLIVYLVAPSGKAASRMKESILKGLVDFTDEFKNKYKDVISKISNLDESTIHRLLGTNYETNGFSYNKNHQFASNSIFVIDESSMIDICLFDALLQAIPDDAFVYILGDKHQLPSVECGAVFGELIKNSNISDNLVELDESIRFKKGTKIYELASIIKNGSNIKKEELDWKDFDEFSIKEEDSSKPIFYYNNYKNGYSLEYIIKHVVKIWADTFYQSLQDKCSNLDINNLEYLDKLFKYTEVSKILCAENKGISGISNINNYIKQLVIDVSIPSSIYGYYPGMLMMLNKNNKNLDLYNGDSGVLVTFDNSDTLYLMVRKKAKFISLEKFVEDEIFMLNGYTFYPLRLIASSEIDLAYAITIHKSQGSDYENILVVLPSKKGHLLLNRQIVYTAITRTKGNTYILSTHDALVEAKDTIMERDTNIS